MGGDSVVAEGGFPLVGIKVSMKLKLNQRDDLHPDGCVAFISLWFSGLEEGVVIRGKGGQKGAQTGHCCLHCCSIKLAALLYKN